MALTSADKAEIDRLIDDKIEAMFARLNAALDDSDLPDSL